MSSATPLPSDPAVSWADCSRREGVGYHPTYMKDFEGVIHSKAKKHPESKGGGGYDDRGAQKRGNSTLGGRGCRGRMCRALKLDCKGGGVEIERGGAGRGVQIWGVGCA
eukprot:762781-Hanusia_phi.AAC.13